MKTIPKIIIIILCCQMILSCRHQLPPLKFFPDKLPEARVGECYRIKVLVSGNRSSIYLITARSDKRLRGLTWHYNKGEGVAALKGIPEIPGKYEITVRAYCRGTQETGQTGEKMYQFSVKPE